MPSHPLTHFEIQEYYQNEQRFKDVYLKNESLLHRILKVYKQQRFWIKNRWKN